MHSLLHQTPTSPPLARAMRARRRAAARAIASRHAFPIRSPSPAAPAAFPVVCATTTRSASSRRALHPRDEHTRDTHTHTHARVHTRPAPPRIAPLSCDHLPAVYRERIIHNDREDLGPTALSTRIARRHVCATHSLATRPLSSHHRTARRRATRMPPSHHRPSNDVPSLHTRPLHVSLRHTTRARSHPQLLVAIARTNK